MGAQEHFRAGPAAGVRVHLLGSFAVAVDDCLVPDGGWRLRKAKTLVKLLALAPGHRLHREQVIAVLWPDRVRPAARGLGIAQRLVDELFGVCRSLGFRSLYIETSPEKMGQQYAWYRRLGFRETTKLGFQDLDTVVAMERPLYAA